MALNNLFTREKREKHFFPTYLKQAETAQIAAKYLKELVKSDDPSAFPALRQWEVFGRDMD